MPKYRYDKSALTVSVNDKNFCQQHIGDNIADAFYVGDKLSVRFCWPTNSASVNSARLTCVRRPFDCLSYVTRSTMSVT